MLAKKEQEEGHIQEMHALLICLAAKITALTRNTTIQRLRYEGGGGCSLPLFKRERA